MSYPYPHFLLHPNFHITSKYFTYADPAEELQNEFADGYEIVVDWFHTEELVAMIEKGFREIVKKYDLEAHYDNLLMLALQQMIFVETSITELKLQNEQQLRTKQLAALLLTYKETSDKDRTFSALQVNSIATSAKITDHKAIEFILKMLHNGIRDGNFGTIGGIEWGMEKRFFDETTTGKVLNTEKLKREASKSIISYKKKIKSYHADFCLHLYKYLVGETNIRPNKATLISDQMLNFYFDLLVLLEFIDPNKIDSDPKDYVGSLLRNRLNKLKG